MSSREELHITAMDNQYFTDIGAEYFTPIEEIYWESKGGRPGETPVDAAVDPAAAPTGDAAVADAGAAAAGVAEPAAPPTGPGWVVQLTGYHYHNTDKTDDARVFLDRTLLKQLAEGKVRLPDGANEQEIDVPMQDVSITHAWLVQDKTLVEETIDPDAALYGAGNVPQYQNFARGDDGDGDGDGDRRRGRRGRDRDDDDDDDDESDGLGQPPEPRWFKVMKYQFVVQFCWQPKTRAERRELAAARAEAEKVAAEAAAAAGDQAVDEGAGLDGGAAAEAPPIEEPAAAEEPAAGDESGAGDDAAEPANDAAGEDGAEPANDAAGEERGADAPAGDGPTADESPATIRRGSGRDAEDPTANP